LGRTQQNVTEGNVPRRGKKPLPPDHKSKGNPNSGRVQIHHGPGSHSPQSWKGWGYQYLQ